MVRKRKLVLSFPELVELGSTGKCKIKFVSGYTIGSTYQIAKIDGYGAKVERKTSHSIELSLVEMPKSQPRGELRKVNLLKLQKNGAFVGKRDKYELGEELAVAEAYHFIYERLMQENKESGVEFMHRVADEHRVDVEKVRSLAAWFNADKVVAELMPKRIKVVEEFTVKAQEIVPELWADMGLKWVSEEFEYQKKKQYIGPSKWNANGNVIVYRYEMVEENA